jgi:hypothetical protein
MAVNGEDARGIKQLVEKYRQEFRIPENVKYYTHADYRNAEKQFIKFCLKNGPAAGSGFSK